MTKNEFIEEKVKEFKEMRSLSDIRQIWIHHPMGVGRDIDKWLRQSLEKAISYGEGLDNKIRLMTNEEINNLSKIVQST